MHRPTARLSAFTLACLSVVSAEGAASRPDQPVPRLVKFAGVVAGVQGTVGLTFAFYADQAGETPLWTETQRVTVDETGRFAVYLGASRPDGLPVELFATGDARWLGVQAEGQPEQPRVLLVSVPYALKAADAETIGGKPPSAFVLAGDTTGVGPDGLTYVDTRVLKSGLSGAGPLPQGAGTANYIGMFTDPTTLGNSVIYQSGSSIGVGTTAPAAAFHSVATAAPGAFFDVYSNALGALPVVFRAARGTPAAPSAVQTDDILGGLAVRGYGATAFTSGRGQVMFKAAEPWTDAGNGTYLQFTTTPIGSATWAERMRIDPAGRVGIGTQTPGQLLSVAGVVESTTGGFRFPDGTTQATAGGTYTAGAGLSLTSTAFSVIFAGTGAATMAARSDHQHDSAYVALGGSYNNPAWLTGLAATKIVGNLPVAQVTGAATLTAPNTFTGTQTVTGGNLALPATVGATAGVLTLGGQSFLHALGATSNTFVGGQAGGGGATTGSSNTGTGYQALYANTTGNYNTASGANALFTNTTGSYNTGSGVNALYHNTTASNNTAFGTNALNANTTGDQNTASGANALQNNTTGAGNTASGFEALFANTTGWDNTASGAIALNSNTTGSSNTASGVRALSRNTTGSFNTASGNQALNSNTTGVDNSAFGASSLTANVAGNWNSAFGKEALRHGNGDANTAVGVNSLWDVTTGARNTAVGTGAGPLIIVGTNNTFVGYAASPSGDLTNATAIGAGALVSASNTLVLGGTGVSVGIGTSAPYTKLQVVGDIRLGTYGGNGCVLNFDGGAIAGTCSSDIRLKTNVRPFEPVLDRVVRLQPVRFNWNAEQFPEYHFGAGLNSGLIAQNVEQVFPEMVATDERGYKMVNYAELPYLTLSAVKELKAENEALRARVEAGDAQIRKLGEKVAVLTRAVAALRDRRQ